MARLHRRTGPAPRSWDLLTLPPAGRRRTSSFRLRAAAGIATAAAASGPVLDAAMAVARLALDGLAARLAAVVAVLVAVLPVLWRLARWGVEGAR